MNFNLPKKVLVLYDKYTEERSVDGRGNIGAGKPLSRKSMEGLVKDLLSDRGAATVVSSFIPSNIVFLQYSYVSHKIIFKTEARQQLLMFNDRLESLKSGHYAIPNLIWIVVNDTLHMFAYTKWEEQNTVLYRAPFANMSDNKVCTGIGLPKDKNDLVKLISEVEAIFWETYFTHTTSTLVIKGNFANSWKKMLQANKFDDKLLIDTKLKLSDICK